MKRAIVVGASSGIGRELAKLLCRAGYRVGVTARREALLRELADEVGEALCYRVSDVSDVEASEAALEDLIAQLGGLDLAVISAGVGYPNPDFDFAREDETIAVNVRGFTSAANLFMRHFRDRGSGHLVALSSLAALRGIAGAPAYNASKAFESSYLEGLRQASVSRKLGITVTDCQLGLVNTAMAKVDRIPDWVSGPEVAAAQILRAIEKRRRHVYVTRRWRLLAWALKLAPGFVWDRVKT